MSKKNPHKIVPFVLKTKWFDMIAAGIKPEEYREITPYWAKRLEPLFDNPPDWVHFYLGYQVDRAMIKTQFVSIEKRTGNPEWGAEPDKVYYVIKINLNYGK